MSAKVRYEPPPRVSFWKNGKVNVEHPDVRSYPFGIDLSVTPTDDIARRDLVRNNSTGNQYPLIFTEKLRSLCIGTLLGPTTMRILKEIDDLHEIRLELDVTKKMLTVFFPVISKHKRGRVVSQFKFQVGLSQVKSILEAPCGSQGSSWVLSLTRTPEYFVQTNDIFDTFKDNSQVWHINNSWSRVTDIPLNYDDPMNHPVALYHNSSGMGYIEIGRWTTFRLSFDLSFGQDSEIYQHFQSALEDFNIPINRRDDIEFHIEGPCAWDWLDHQLFRLPSQPSALLGLPTATTTNLPFEVRYQLEVCISRGLFNEYSISPEFLQRLSALTPAHGARLLEYLMDQNERLFNPLDLFNNDDYKSFVPNPRIPHYCTLVRKASITPTTVLFNSPTVETSNRVLRKYSHMQDRFLRIQFVEECESRRIGMNKQQNDNIWKRVRRALFHGIRVGDRTFEFLAFGSSQLRQNGAYFFCPTDYVSCDDIRAWMGEFSHIKIVAKYAARLGQCFSTTREIRGICEPAIKQIDDIERNGYCFTDGIGKISQFIARIIIEDMTLDVFDDPTAFQFRMGGCKGVLAVWPQAKGMEVHIRKSQEKFRTDFKGLEIIRCAKYTTATLNRQTITILESLGVQKKAFMTLLCDQIQSYEQAAHDNAAAIQLLTKFVDENQSTLILSELLKAGFKSTDTEDPFTVNLLNLWRSWSLKLLKEKARIHIPKSAFVLGCVDETGTLRGHSRDTEGRRSDKDVNKLPQIFLQLTDPERYNKTNIVRGVCIVGRNPSLHPGDIRVVQAVDNPNLRHLKDVVVFSAKGDRPVPNMLSGGDLDGDDFFVIWDPDLIPTEWNHPPMDYAGEKPRELDRDVAVDDLREFFVNYMKNDVLPLIATAHLAYADEYGPKSQICECLARSCLA